MGMRNCAVVLLLAIVCLVLSTCAWAAIPTVPYDQPGPGAVVNAETAVAYYLDDARSETWITIGDAEGLRPTAEVAFLRNGQEVARGAVIQVRTNDAIVRPAEGTPGGAIHRGDAVQVLSNGSRKALDTAIRKERRTEELITIAITVFLGTMIALERS